MKPKSILAATLAVLACLVLNPQLRAATLLGTAFTYQGRLGVGTNAASGIYDFRFLIYDVASGGNPVGSPFTTNGVPVSNGLFLVTLDFGSGAFAGEARWLGIEVKTNTAPSYTPLTPRQPLTPAPQALYALQAGQATSAGSATVATTAGVANGVAPNAVGSAGLQANAMTADKVANGSLTAADLNAASFSNTFWKVDGNAVTP